MNMPIDKHSPHIPETSHPNRGMDYHLNLLGFRDRASWNILASDSVTYNNGLIKCRPDWVLRHRLYHEVVVLEYKNRLLGKGTPTDYERAEVIANAITVGDVLEKQCNHKQNLHAHLFYGDRISVEEIITPQIEEKMRNTALEASAPGLPVTSTYLAEIISGKYDVSPLVMARLAGKAAHNALKTLGPH